MMHHFYLALVSETRSAAGRPEDALAPVEQGLAELDTNGRFYEAELHRLKGELLSALGPARLADARASLQTALTVACAQNAKLFEMGARDSLGRLPAE